uniref:Uncharacterized protein n=1 Tax=Lotus japonicus TaxID=34305 RepID=I3T1G8_LOTJA|nr:unknown [Lotus japonicus]
MQACFILAGWCWTKFSSHRGPGCHTKKPLEYSNDTKLGGG